MLWGRRREPEKEERPRDVTRRMQNLSLAPQAHSMPTGQGPFGAGLQATNVEECFKLKLKNSIDPTDSAEQHVWSYNIPVLTPNEKKLLLEITSGQLVILNLPTTQFPKQMYVYCQTVNGYIDNEADPTNIVAIFRIRQLVPCVIGTTVTYTIIYSLMESITWDIGLSRHIGFKFGDQNGAFLTPLAEQVNLQVKLHHLTY